MELSPLHPKNLLIALILLATVKATAVVPPVRGISDNPSLPFIAGKDYHNCFVNQASLGFISEPVIGITYFSRFGISELAVKSFGIILPYRSRGAFSLYYSNYGFEEYLHHFFSGAGGFRLSETLLFGVEAGLEVLLIPGTETRSIAATCSGGVIYTPSATSRLAIHVVNPVPNSLRNSPMPGLIRTGAETDLSDKVTVSALLEKRTGTPLSLTTGFTYGVRDGISVTAGYSSGSRMLGFSLLWSFGNYNSSLSFLTHNRLGLSTIASIYRGFSR
jgi:hypothetical protein